MTNRRADFKSIRRRDTILFALLSALSPPFKTLVVVLTLGAGVATVVTAVSVVRGYGAAAEAAAYGVYARSLVIRENFYSPDRRGPPLLSDLERLEMAVRDVDAALAWRVARVLVRAGNVDGEIDVYGVYGPHERETNMAVVDGRTLTVRETQRAGRNCVLGRGAADRFFPDGRAVGRTLTMGGIGCEIVGVLEASTTRTSDRFDNAVITPFATAARSLHPRQYAAPNEATWLTIVLPRGADMHDARIAADRALRSARGVPMRRASPYSFADPGAPRRAIERERNLLAALLIAIAATSLLTAIVGYGGALYARISERRREIGLRLTMGAQPHNIALQFLVESGVLGIIGGLVGGLAGLALSSAMAQFWGWQVVIDPATLLIAIILGTLSGVLGGIIPAGRAAISMPHMSVRD